MSEEDAVRLGLRDGDAVRLHPSTGTFDGRLKIAPIRPGNLEVHWPEGNVLLSGSARSIRSRWSRTTTRTVTLVRLPTS